MDAHAVFPLRMPPGPPGRLDPVPTRARGFTAVELLVVIAILAILAALAAPSFTPLMEKWRVRQASEALQSSLYFARSEAIKRGGGVALHKLPNNTNGCTLAPNPADWGCGWQICEDKNNNNQCDRSEPILQRYDTPSGIEVTRSVNTGADSVGFNRWGVTDGNQGLSFTLVPVGKNLSNPAALGVCMSSGGRVRSIPTQDLPCN